MDDDGLVLAHYSQAEESVRLHQTPRGFLERLRTWDLLERWLPTGGVVYDVGGGAGVHAAWLADRGYDVELSDLVPRHVSEATELSEARRPGRSFVVEQADARRIPRGDDSADVLLMLGPLYHLVETSERKQALIEARCLLRPGGLLVAAGISRFAWLMDAYRKEIADSAEVQASIAYSLQTGHSNADPEPGAFWAYFHRPDELTDEITAADFGSVSIAGVEGFAWMLPSLGAILDSGPSAEALMVQLRTKESEPSVVGASGHLLARGVKPV